MANQIRYSPRPQGAPQLSRARRLGFSLIEILAVFVIFGLLLVASLPRMNRLKDKGEISSATVRFTRAVFAARQAAIQRGKTAYFKSGNNSVWVLVDESGELSDSIVITSPINLLELYHVTVTPGAVTSVEYDPRGVSTQATKQVFQFSHRSGLVDSLCISRLGNTIREKCP